MDQNATLNGRIEQEFKDLDRGWVAAYLQGTTELFDRVWADGFIFTSPFGQFTNKEREIADRCLASDESRALIHAFFAERGVSKIPDIPKDTRVLEIRKAAIVGAGTMGGGIAMSYANSGIPVLLKEVDDAALQRGLATIRKNYESSVAKGRMSQQAYERTMALITPTTSYDGFDTVDIVVEAVFENMDLKKKTFAELGAVTRLDDIDAVLHALDGAPHAHRGVLRPGR